MSKSIAFCLLSLVFPAVMRNDGTEDVQKLIQISEQHLSEQNTDAAIESLLLALDDLDSISDDTERASLRSNVSSSLKRVDPLDTFRRNQQAKAASEYIDLAREYQALGWLRAARAAMRDAQAVHPIYGENRRAVHVQVYSTPIDGMPGLEPVPVDEGREGDLLPYLAGIEQNLSWTCDPEGMKSPSDSHGNNAFLSAASPTHEDARISIEVKLDSQLRTVAGFAFGNKGWSDHYITDLWAVPEEETVGVRLWHLVDNEPTFVAAADGPMNAELMDSWNTLHVEVTGHKARISFVGVTVDADCPTLPYGGFGLFLSSDTLSRKPICFRNLHVVDRSTGSSEGDSALRTESEQDMIDELEFRFDSARRLLLMERTEAGVLDLLAVRQALPRIVRATERRSLERKVDETL